MVIDPRIFLGCSALMWRRDWERLDGLTCNSTRWLSGAKFLGYGGWGLELQGQPEKGLGFQAAVMGMLLRLVALV